jgi:hypothetical protein
LVPQNYGIINMFTKKNYKSLKFLSTCNALIQLYWMEMMYFFLPAFSQWLTMEFFRRRIKAKEIQKLKL